MKHNLSSHHHHPPFFHQFFTQDETAYEPVLQFCGLRSKMYSLKLLNKTEKLACKGISNAYRRQCIRHEHYLEALRRKTANKCKSYRIKSYKHRLYTVCENKIGLLAWNDKRFFVNDDTSYPYGHVFIRNKIIK